MSNGPSDYRKWPLYVALFCAAFLLLTGSYLTLTDNFALGINSKDNFRPTANEPEKISGEWIIIIAIVIGFFPAYFIV